MNTTANTSDLNTYIQAEVWTPLSEAARYLREGTEILGKAESDKWGMAGGLAKIVADLSREHPESRELRGVAKQLDSARIKYYAAAKRMRIGRDGLRGKFGIPERTPMPSTTGLSENVTRSAPESWGPRETNATAPDVMAMIAKMGPAERASFEQAMAAWKNGGGVPGEQLAPAQPEKEPKLYDATLDVPAPVKDVTAEAPKGASAMKAAKTTKAGRGQGMANGESIPTAKCDNCDKETIEGDLVLRAVNGVDFLLCTTCVQTADGLKVAA